jgi:Fe-S-cluster-containing dehydrogenase component/formate-dependent nitrite reductase membrane component NrfD
MKLAKIIDQTRCIGCHACTTACKSENEVPIGVDRTRVKYVETGAFPNTRRHFQVTRCNQCDHPPCVYICPVTAMYQRPDGIVEFDQDVCIGCRACMAACPYDAVYIDPETHSAAKCHFCAHRIELSLQPACVVVCPAEAIIVGDLEDPESVVSRRIAREGVQVRKPELGTQPKLYYIGGTNAALRPEAAARPGGGIFMWSSQRRDDETVGQGAGTMASAILSYDTGHTIPWGTDVALYMWTKSIAAGVMLVAGVGGIFGSSLRPLGGSLATLVAPLLAFVFLAATMFFLIKDLEHPKKFYTILTRPQWKSWLVRGAIILMVFGALIPLWLIPQVGHGMFGMRALPWWYLKGLSLVTVPVAAAAAGYTAFLLAQATGRELWATPLAAPHLVGQALLAGSASLTMAAIARDGQVHGFLPRLFVLSLICHAGFVVAELWTPHRSAHVRRAVDVIVKGKYASVFWVVAVLIGVSTPIFSTFVIGGALGLGFAAACALVGLFAWEYVWTYGGQSVPLS